MGFNRLAIDTFKNKEERNLHSIPEEALNAIAEAIRGLDFGSIEITVHEGRINQIERREKFRFKS